MAKKYDYFFILPQGDGSFTVKGVIVRGYPAYSVLAGQDMICYVDSYATLEEAQADYPEANISSKWTAPHNYFNHLPDEGDF